MSLKSSLWSVWAVLRCTGLRVTRGNSASSLCTDLLLWTHHHQVTIIIIIMGNDMSCGNGGNRAFIERQMSNASGKDVATIQGFYNDFRNECPSGKKGPWCWWLSCLCSGKLSPQKFTELCKKVLGSDQADVLQQKAFCQFDKHNDGNVNFRDFLMVVHLTSNGSAEDKLRTMFSLYDLDGNGSIEASEMERYSQRRLRRREKPTKVFQISSLSY